ncbi:MAG: hypothetical protein LBT54_04135, partial [Bifidobacteriaceae bacterium]|nr:hypothetical protein [Bifidobacteriaceae bacterium]
MAWPAAAALVLGVAVVQPGFSVDRVDLNDASVWLTNEAEGKLGRYNVPIKELTGGVRGGDAEFDVLQDASDIVLDGASGLRVVDPAAVEPGEPVGLPPKHSAALGAGVAAVVDEATGLAWARTVDKLPGLRTASDKADFELGVGGRATVGVDGTVFAVSHDAGRVAVRWPG